jgi:glyoxylase-like metal-dependent hydrolase (beta-lactamase superfamily II)
MIIAMNTGGIAATNSYLVGDDQTNQAVLFDAPDHTVAPLLDEAQKRGLDVIGLWLTHGHFDHVADHAEVTRRYPNARVLIHRLDEPKLQNPGSTVFALPFTIPPRPADAHVEDGQELTLGTLRVNVIHTPGHAPGHVMYHFPDQKILVGGDLIIAGSVGRTDLPDSDHAELERSIRKVMRLPGDTRLLPGHGPVSTLDQERRTNPFVKEVLAGTG